MATKESSDTRANKKAGEEEGLKFHCFCFDGVDLYWTDDSGAEREKSDLMTMGSLEDAVWCQMVWQSFADGNPSEPILVTNEDGSVSILAE